MLVFKAMTASDVARIIKLEQIATNTPWTNKQLMSSLQGKAEAKIIENAEAEIGYFVIQPMLDEAEILNLVIFKPFQNQAYGQASVAKLKQDLIKQGMRRIFLEVRDSNKAAQALYQKMGFTMLNRRKAYYRSHGMIEDAIVMQAVLSG